MTHLHEDNDRDCDKESNLDSLATIKVDSSRLDHNLDQFSGEHQLAPVIKSNAYGHGLELVAKHLTARSDIEFACVAAYREAKRLRRQDIDLPLLIIGYTPAAQIQESGLSDTAFTIVSLEHLKQIDEQLTDAKTFHLKVETGMHRYGIKSDKLDEALTIIADNQRIQLTGAFSHFSDAYEPDSEFTQTQINRWNQAVATIRQSEDLKHFHLAATSGHFYRQDITANIERVGIGMYGITGFASQLNLKPALSLRTQIATTKEISAGEYVGYSRSFQASEDKRLGVLPIGYQEGIDRRLSNTGTVRVKGGSCPIVGKVSMNATMVDITDTENISAGDNVTVLSANPQDPNSVLTVADKIGTIPYEILVHISPELKRVITTFD